MAEPMTAFAVASFVIGAASAVASGVQQQQQAKTQNRLATAQAENYKKAAEQQSLAAAIEYADKSAAERISQMQNQEKKAQGVQAAQREAIQKAGQMMASTNAAGGTLNYLMADYARQQGLAEQAYRDQYQMAVDNSNTQIQSYQHQTQNRLDSRQSYTYAESDESFNYIGTALGIGKAAVGAYGSYMAGMPNTTPDPTTSLGTINYEALAPGAGNYAMNHGI